MQQHLDETDRRIIRELQLDARQTNQEIAKKIGIAASTLTRRIQLLESEGIIKGYTCVVESSTLGYSTLGYTLVTLTTPSKKPIDEVIRRFSEVPEVAEICKIFGEDDLIVKIYAEDNRHYQKVIEKFRSADPDDGYHTKSMLVSEVVYRGGIANVIEKTKADGPSAQATIVAKIRGANG
jgi:DNA-binding Lrp family transcriptional regulator